MLNHRSVKSFVGNIVLLVIACTALYFPKVTSSQGGAPDCGLVEKRECWCQDYQLIGGCLSSGCANRYTYGCENNEPVDENNGVVVYRFIYDSNGNNELDAYDIISGAPAVDKVIDYDTSWPDYETCDYSNQQQMPVIIKESLIWYDPFDPVRYPGDQDVPYPNNCDSLDRAYSESQIGGPHTMYQNVGFRVFGSNRIAKVYFGIGGVGEEFCNPVYSYWTPQQIVVLCSRDNIPSGHGNQIIVLVAGDPSPTPPPNSCSIASTVVSTSLTPAEVSLGSSLNIGTTFNSLYPNPDTVQVRYTVNPVGVFDIIGNATQDITATFGGVGLAPISVQSSSTALVGDIAEIKAEVYMDEALTCQTSTYVKNVDYSPWWSVRNGDIIAAGIPYGGIPSSDGDITSPVPITAPSDPLPKLFIDSGYRGMPIYTGTLSLAPGDVSTNLNPSISPNWNVDAPALPGIKTPEDGYYNYDYFLEKTTITPAMILDPPPDTIRTGLQLQASGALNGAGYRIIKATRSLTLTTNMNLFDQKVILFVDGDLTLKGKVNLNDGKGFFMAIVKGDIYVDPLVGDILPNPDRDIEGIYLTDKQIHTGAGTIPLYLSGIFVGLGYTTNPTGEYVAGNNDAVVLERDLGVNNALYPAEIFEYRIDQVMLMPSVYGEKSVTWKEVKP